MTSNAFVDRVYSTLSPVYDFLFGPLLQPGRRAAIARMPVEPGTRVLEIGVGTGINASLYPRGCQVIGIDISARMLEKAAERIAREGLRGIQLQNMDAAHLKFPDESFDVVYAPYTISVVPDPIRVAREMRRVCRRGGVIVILNHFRSRNRLLARIERALTPLTLHVGFRSDLDLAVLLAGARLTPASIEHVNRPRSWSLVICTKD